MKLLFKLLLTPHLYASYVVYSRFSRLLGLAVRVDDRLHPGLQRGPRLGLRDARLVRHGGAIDLFAQLQKVALLIPGCWF